MTSYPTVLVNCEGAYYDKGKSFTNSKWLSIAQKYIDLIDTEGKCSVRKLAKSSKISIRSAQKVIVSINEDGQLPLHKKKGHQLRGPGSISGLRKEHHNYIYFLYKQNPSLPLYGYCEELLREYNINISEQTLNRWFNEIGPFKGSLRKTGTRPTGRETYRVCLLLQK